MPAWRYRCPEGHSSVELYSDRFRCWACDRGDGPRSYPMSELVDLAEGAA